MSSESLSREEAISQFCGVTGAEEERAKYLLEACNWNLELAINMHVDTDDGRGNRNNRNASTSSANPIANHSSTSLTGNSGAGTSRDATILVDYDDDDINELGKDEDEDGRTSDSNSRNNHRVINRQAASRAPAGMFRQQMARKQTNNPYSDSSDNVRPPIPPIRQVLVNSSDVAAGYSQDLPQRRYNTRTGAMSDVYDAFRDFQAEAQWQEMANQQESTSESSSVHLNYVNSNVDPATSANKARTLQDLFRPPLEILFRGSLSSARDAGTQQNKWLLVNIQNGREFPCQILNRDVWSNQTVKDIIKEHFIFWQVYHDSFEGSKFLQYYNVSNFPHVSIIDPRTGESMKTWPISIDHNSFCDSVIEFLTEHPSPDGSSDVNTMKKLRVKEEDGASIINDCPGVSGNMVNSQASTLLDQSEEAQLEAAIKASLKETTVKSTFLTENSNSSRTYIDDDSYTDAIDSDNDQTQQTTSSASSKFNDNNSPFDSVKIEGSEFFGVGRRVAAKSNNNSSHSENNKNTNSNSSNNNKSIEPKKEKVEVSPDEYKKYLGVDTDTFSDLVVRFPDGNREQFKFPSDSLMKALFLLLTSRGYGIDSYNYVTNFPRRLLHELPSTDTLHDAKLLRETIFIERKASD